MILEDETYEAFGYLSSVLIPQSNKLIIAVCELCGVFRILHRCDYRTFCQSCSAVLGGKQKGKIHTDEHKALISKNHADVKGKNNPNFGKTPSEETKAKMSAAKKGEKSSNFGKNGKDASAYKGGKRLYIIRNNVKRRKLGYTLLLPLVEGEVGHHVTDEYVIGIPEVVHKKLSGYLRKKHRTKMLQWLKANDKGKYKSVLCVLAKEPFLF